MDEKLFDIVSHFRTSYSYVEDSTEKQQLAQLWVRAAERAKMSSAIEPAYEYASVAVTMLGDSWQQDYSLTFKANLVRPKFLFRCNEKLTQIVESGS